MLSDWEQTLYKKFMVEYEAAVKSFRPKFGDESSIQIARELKDLAQMESLFKTFDPESKAAEKWAKEIISKRKQILFLIKKSNEPN